jgi:peptidoglycan/xylan/chitin deacetylase (PgdA/CDA1 family)
MAARVKRLEPPARNGVPWLVALAALLVAAALAALVWGASAPFQVVVDGTARTVDPGATVADLSAKGYFTARAGDLYGVDGKVARRGAANAPSYVRNGQPASDADRLYPADNVRSVNGADAREAIISVRISIDPTATIEGSGPILTVVRQGRPGVALVHRGEVTGLVVSTKILAPASNIVLAASHPKSSDKLVALTFDDGPWPETTLAIVNILKQEGVPGTFFELGEQVQRTPSISRAVVSAGESIGNHSWSHPWLTKLKPAAIRHQITDSANAIKAATGAAPTLFRPPYGAINRNVWAQAKSAREQVVLWNVDSLDWTRPGVDRIVQNVTKGMGRASIVLMHDGGGDRSQTIAALPIVISWLKSHGYKFVTVAELEQIR